MAGIFDATARASGLRQVPEGSRMLLYVHLSPFLPERVAFYNPVGPEPPTYPHPPEEVAPGLFFAILFSPVNSTELQARGIYNVAVARNCEGTCPGDAECAYIDEPVILFA